jgi:hypothetical protein
MTAHSPDLVQAKSITLTQIHDRSLTWPGTGKINNSNTQIHVRSLSWLGFVCQGYWFYLYQVRRVSVMYLCVRVIDFACAKSGEWAVM